jgi:hypothetical protein
MMLSAGRAAKRARRRFTGQAVLLTADTADVHPARVEGPKGLPLREVLQELYLSRRDRTFAEAVWFLLYGLVFVFVTYSIANPPGAYQQNAALMDLFLDEEIPGYVAGWGKDGPRGILQPHRLEGAPLCAQVHLQEEFLRCHDE